MSMYIVETEIDGRTFIVLAANIEQADKQVLARDSTLTLADLFTCKLENVIEITTSPTIDGIDYSDKP